MRKVGKEKFITLLIEAMKNDKDEDVKRNAARALGEIGDPKTVDALIEVMKKDEDEDVRWVAAMALEKINEALDPSDPLRKKIEKVLKEK